MADLFAEIESVFAPETIANTPARSVAPPPVAPAPPPATPSTTPAPVPASAATTPVKPAPATPSATASPTTPAAPASTPANPTAVIPDPNKPLTKGQVEKMSDAEAKAWLVGGKR